MACTNRAEDDERHREKFAERNADKHQHFQYMTQR